DSANLTSLSLIANDHFVSSRYQQAIDVWTQMLDSQHRDLDRVSIIHSLNQAKQLLK
ncbi:nitrite reductase, partial [Vibrio xuii]